MNLSSEVPTELLAIQVRIASYYTLIEQNSFVLMQFDKRWSFPARPFVSVSVFSFLLFSCTRRLKRLIKSLSGRGPTVYE